MKITVESTIYIAATCCLTTMLSAFADDAVGVMSIDAGTNGIVEAEMPFNAFGGNGPASFTNTMAIPCNTMGSCLYDYE